MNFVSRITITLHLVALFSILLGFGIEMPYGLMFIIIGVSAIVIHWTIIWIFLGRDILNFKKMFEGD